MMESVPCWDLERPAVTIDAVGHATEVTFDALGRVVATTDALGMVTETAFDPVGRVVETRDGTGIPTHFAYDAVARLTTVLDALGGLTTYGYDARGNRVSVLVKHGGCDNRALVPGGCNSANGAGATRACRDRVRPHCRRWSGAPRVGVYRVMQRAADRRHVRLPRACYGNRHRVEREPGLQGSQGGRQREGSYRMLQETLSVHVPPTVDHGTKEGPCLKQQSQPCTCSSAP
jgi:YD repeat-containing protein